MIPSRKSSHFSVKTYRANRGQSRLILQCSRLPTYWRRLLEPKEAASPFQVLLNQPIHQSHQGLARARQHEGRGSTVPVEFEAGRER